MEHLVSWLQSLLYCLFCGFVSLAVPLFFIVMAIQFITKGRVDSGKAIGTVTKVAVTAAKLVAGGGKRRR